MTPRQILVLLAIAFAVAGVLLGQKTHSVSGGVASIDCGSVFQPSKFESRISDSVSGGDAGGDCSSKISDAKPIVYGALGLAGIAVIVAIVAPTPAPTPKREDSQ